MADILIGIYCTGLMSARIVQIKAASARFISINPLEGEVRIPSRQSISDARRMVAEGCLCEERSCYPARSSAWQR